MAIASGCALGCVPRSRRTDGWGVCLAPAVLTELLTELSIMYHYSFYGPLTALLVSSVCSVFNYLVVTSTSSIKHDLLAAGSGERCVAPPWPCGRPLIAATVSLVRRGALF